MKHLILTLISFNLWSLEYRVLVNKIKPIERVSTESLSEFQLRRSAWNECQDHIFENPGDQGKIETYKCYYSEILNKSAILGYNMNELNSYCEDMNFKKKVTIKKSIKEILCEHKKACASEKTKFKCLSNPLDRHLASVLED